MLPGIKMIPPAMIDHASGDQNDTSDHDRSSSGDQNDTCAAFSVSQENQWIPVRPTRKANRSEHRQGESRCPMRSNYDFSKATKNPYAKLLKKPVTIRLDEETVEYFKKLAEESDIPYQTLINLYLRDCAASKKRLKLAWKT
jgi:predicted DNA binding CopG/RHH family protein